MYMIHNNITTFGVTITTIISVIICLIIVIYNDVNTKKTYHNKCSDHNGIDIRTKNGMLCIKKDAIIEVGQ